MDFSSCYIPFDQLRFDVHWHLIYSALYVVDLVKFRQMAAGDTLRVYYETLSKDPNSLSNLDQVKVLESLFNFEDGKSPISYKP